MKKLRLKAFERYVLFNKEGRPWPNTQTPMSPRLDSLVEREEICVSVLSEGETRHYYHIGCTLKLNEMKWNQECRLEIVLSQNKITNFLFCVLTPDCKANGPRGHKREFFRKTRDCIPWLIWFPRDSRFLFPLCPGSIQTHFSKCYLGQGYSVCSFLI